MSPYIDILGKAVPSYWLMSLLGAAAASVYLLFASKRVGLKGEDAVHISILSVIGVLVGGKLLYIITILPNIFKNAALIVQNPAVLLELFGPGMVFYGGLFGAIFAAALYIRRYRLDAALYSDAMAPAIPLFHAFARAGCFLAGCCYGVPCEHGIAFENPLAAPARVALFPVQLVESACDLLIFAGLLIYSRKTHKRGGVLPAYLAGYAVCRFVLEFFRGDEIRGHLWIFSTSQWISVALLITVAALWRLKKSKAAR